MCIRATHDPYRRHLPPPPYPTRGTVFIIAGGVLTGFVLYFFSDVVFALGLSDSIPVTLAAWTPSGVATLLGLAMLLHLEDG